jgi:hypothetical protein
MKYLIFMACIFVSSHTYSQFTFDPSSDVAKCPDRIITYQLLGGDPANCSFEWEVTNGVIIQSNSSSFTTTNTSISVEWNNNSSSGTIEVTATKCSDTTSRGFYDQTEAIITLSDQTPGEIIGDDEIPANVTSNRGYDIERIYLPQGTAEARQEADYEWELPPGWSIVSGGNSPSITVRPDAFSEGNIRVRGVSSS